MAGKDDLHEQVDRLVQAMERHATYSQEFLKSVSGRRFRNPETGNEVLFQSLPPAEQAKIYSQWGELLYESTDYENHGWDGTYLKTEEQVPMDVYVYVMKIKGLDGIDYKYSGTVTLFR